METLRRLLPVLREHGVQYVEVHFDGSGDQGSIDYVDYSPRDLAFDPDAVTLEHPRVSQCFHHGEWIQTRERLHGSVAEVLDALTNDYLEETGVNWYDNDGGFGQLDIEVEAGTVELTIDVRYTESTTEFFSQRDIQTGEEL